MDANNWQSSVTAFGAIATPLLVLTLSAFGWKYRSKINRNIDIEDKLREDRISTYNQILEPFILLFMNKEGWESDKKNRSINKDELAVSKLISHEYRKAAFKLSLIANDEVVRAYNNLMQNLYNYTDEESKKGEGLKLKLELLGKFLLEIRKNMGNGSTKLNHWNMLEWFLKDIQSVRKF